MLSIFIQLYIIKYFFIITIRLYVLKMQMYSK